MQQGYYSKRTKQQCKWDETRPVADDRQAGRRAGRQTDTDRQARMSCAGAPERVEKRARVTY